MTRAPVDRDAWTCPDCLRTYRIPTGWEPAVWLSARRAAQYLHADRHGRPILRDRRRRRDDPPVEDDTPTPVVDPAD